MCMNNVIQSRGHWGLLSGLTGPCFFTQTHVAMSQRTTAHVRACSHMSSRTRAKMARLNVVLKLEMCVKLFNPSSIIERH